MEASALAPAGLSRISVAGPLLRLRSDEQLVALFRGGDDAAFGVIHDRYRARLLAYARQMLGGSRQDAEDALQDVFLRTYHALRADDRPISLRAWLYRVAHNRCVDHLRRPAPAPVELSEGTGGPSDDPLAEAERRDDLRRLVADIRRLPEQQRSALLMRELDGMSYAELATALDATVPAVKSLLVRARMGLVEAVEARDTACADIREDLADRHDRGVRATALARRHLRDCAGCRTWRTALQGTSGQLGALVPAGPGPFAGLAHLLGLGGAGGAAAGAGGAVALGSGGLVTGGTLAGASIGTKLTALAAGVALTAGGANEVRKHVLEPGRPGHAAAATRAAPTGGAADPSVDRARATAAQAVGASARHPARGGERAPAPSAADAREPQGWLIAAEPLSPHVAPESLRGVADDLTGGASAPHAADPAPGAVDPRGGHEGATPASTDTPLPGLAPTSAPVPTTPAAEETSRATSEEEVSADPQAGTGGAEPPARGRHRPPG